MIEKVREKPERGLAKLDLFDSSKQAKKNVVCPQNLTPNGKVAVNDYVAVTTSGIYFKGDACGGYMSGQSCSICDLYVQNLRGAVKVGRIEDIRYFGIPEGYDAHVGPLTVKDIAAKEEIRARAFLKEGDYNGFMDDFGNNELRRGRKLLESFEDEEGLTLRNLSGEGLPVYVYMMGIMQLNGHRNTFTFRMFTKNEEEAKKGADGYYVVGARLWEDDAEHFHEIIPLKLEGGCMVESRPALATTKIIYALNEIMERLKRGEPPYPRAVT